ncbi:MAG: glycoside hydrolase family 16 protein [Methylobacterium sp.]
MVDLTGYKLTFDEEFNALSVSQTGKGTVWADIRESQRLNKNADIGFGQSAFVDKASGIDPFSVGQGALTITATQAPSSIVGPGKWASGLLHTKATFSQTYGYFEMRAETPANLGAWPAFWMMPADGSWPPELDVMEGNGTKDLYQVIHTKETGTHTGTSVYSSQPTMTAGFHTYGVSWDNATIKFYYDGVLTGTRKTPADMNKAMYLLVDLAVHDNSAVDATDKIMKVDYIRAYSNDPTAKAVALDHVSSPDGVDTSDLHGAVSAAATPTLPPVVPTPPVPPIVPGPPATSTDLSHTKTYAKDGTLAREVIVHADLTKDVYIYGITGKAYTAEHDRYDKAGALIGVVQTHADGTPAYTMSLAADGTKTIASYDAKGLLVSQTVREADGDATTSTYAAGVLKNERTTYAAGSGDLSVTKDYVGGVQTREAVVHADKTKDITNLNITGKDYVSEHSAYDAAGKLTLSELVMKDGSHVTSVFGAAVTLTAKADVVDVFKNLSSGGDTFVFHENFGKDVIKGFHATGVNHDVVQFDDSFAKSFAELQTKMHSSGADTVITFDGHDSLTLAGVKMKDLSAADFHFVHHDGLLV